MRQQRPTGSKRFYGRRHDLTPYIMLRTEEGTRMSFIDGTGKNKAFDGATSGDSESVASPSGSGKKRVKRRKPEEMLASVVRESTVNAAIDLLRQNVPFALPGGNSWVALGLPVAQIGGLSKKQQKDEEKGSLIELINHDLIQAITTRYLLDQEILGIIPTPRSLERMEEYSLLTSAKYHWMVLTPSPDGQELLVNPVDDKEAGYADVVAVANGSRSLADYLPHVWAWTQAINDSPAPANTVEGVGKQPLPQFDAVSLDEDDVAAPVNASSYPAGVPSLETDEGLDDEPNDDPSLSEGPLMSGAEIDEELAEGTDEGLEQWDPEEIGDDGQDEHDDDPDDEVSEPWDRYVEHNRDREFTEEQVRATIARRFLSDDLGLEIALDEFEATFNTQAPAIRLDLDERSADKPSDWLGEQVSLLADQANLELEKLHRDHREELRRLFVETMSLHAESVIRAVDEQREGSVYHLLTATADKEHRELKARAPEDISAQRIELTRRYDKDADDRAEIAAAQARQAFWDRNGPEFERRIADMAIEIERRNEERYTHQRRLVLEMRRKDAHTRMQMGTTRAFQLLSEREVAQRESEMELLNRWNAKLTRYIDDNRKQDIARAEALAEQLKLDTGVDRMKAEHARRTEELKIEYETQTRRLQAELGRLTDELERTREQSEARMREREEEWRYKAQTNTRMYTDLVEKTRSMTDTMRQEYTSQLSALERANRSSADELNRVNKAQSRTNKILFVLMGVVSLVAIGVGIIIGWWIGYDAFNPSAMVLPVRFI